MNLYECTVQLLYNNSSPKPFGIAVTIANEGPKPERVERWYATIESRDSARRRLDALNTPRA